MSDFSSKIDDLFADGLSDEAIAGVLAQEDPDNFEKVVGLLRRRSAFVMVVKGMQEELQDILSDAAGDDDARKVRKVAIISYKIGDVIGEIKE